MSRIPHTNTGDGPIYVGNVRIPAGGTRTVDSNLLPTTPATAETPPEDPLGALTELVTGKVTDVIGALASLDEVQLAQLAEIERGGKNRSTLIEAIELTLLERVDEREQAAASQAAASQAAAADAAGTEGAEATE